MSYTHLSRDDRIRLDTLLKTGLSLRGCACNLGYSTPTISSEVNRNGGRIHYNPYKANRRAKKRRFEANQHHRKWTIDNWHTRTATKLLQSKKWSPEQIIGRIQLELNVKPFAVSTVYLNINQDSKLSMCLPRGHSKYRRTKEGNERRRQREKQDTRRSIDQRPKYIDNRKSVGHWEGDTIIGKEKTARILTHVERKTGYLIANILYDVTAEKIRAESIRSFQTIPSKARKTITYDRGTEFADWELTERQIKASIYFANAYCSWERGTNENTNGLIRRYFPKRTKFANIKEAELRQATNQINHRPRKRLGYRSPHEKFWSVKLRMLM